MTTTVEFETAGLADALRRASRVAPARGNALTQFGGILLEVGASRVLVRSTDGDVFLSQFLDPHRIDGDQCTWRVPSQIVTKIVTSLPHGRGQEVTLTGDGSQVTITQGRMTATIGLMDHTLYPMFRPEPIPEAAQRVDGFGTLLDRVSWAASRGEALATSSILVTADRLVAATNNGIATIPHPGLELGSGEALVSLATVSSVLAHMPDVSLWLDDNAMYLAPSPDVQARCRLWGEKFPAWRRAAERTFTTSVLLPSQDVSAILTRLRAVVEREGAAGAHVWLILDRGQLRFHAADSDGTAAVTDTLELLPGMADHDPVTMRVAASVLSSALGKAPGEQLVLRYDYSGHMVRIDGEGGYSCWVPLIRQ